jgi:hypothetical protein
MHAPLSENPISVGFHESGFIVSIVSGRVSKSRGKAIACQGSLTVTF